MSYRKAVLFIGVVLGTSSFAVSEELIFDKVCASENPIESLISEYQISGLVDYFDKLKDVYSEHPMAKFDLVKSALAADHSKFLVLKEKVDRAFVLKNKLTSDESLQVGWVVNSFLKDYENNKKELEMTIADSTKADRFQERPELVGKMKSDLTARYRLTLATTMHGIRSWSPLEKAEFATGIFDILPGGARYEPSQLSQEFLNYLVEVNNNKEKHPMVNSGGLGWGKKSGFLLRPEINSAAPGWELTVVMRGGEEPKNHANLKFVRSPFHDDLIVKACVAIGVLANCKPMDLDKFCGT